MTMPRLELRNFKKIRVAKAIGKSMPPKKVDNDAELLPRFGRVRNTLKMGM